MGKNRNITKGKYDEWFYKFQLSKKNNHAWYFKDEY